MTLRGHIKNRTVVLEEPVDLPEGTDVEVEVRPAAPGAIPGTDDPHSWEQFVSETAGQWQGEPLTRPPQGQFEAREDCAAANFELISAASAHRSGQMTS